MHSDLPLSDPHINRQKSQIACSSLSRLRALAQWKKDLVEAQAQHDQDAIPPTAPHTDDHTPPQQPSPHSLFEPLQPPVHSNNEKQQLHSSTITTGGSDAKKRQDTIVIDEEEDEEQFLIGPSLERRRRRRTSTGSKSVDDRTEVIEVSDDEDDGEQEQEQVKSGAMETVIISDDDVDEEQEDVNKGLGLLEVEDADEWDEEDVKNFPALTDEESALVDKAFDEDYDRSEILVNGFGLEVTRKDLLTLKGSNWLNDEVINFYMELLFDRSKNKSKDGDGDVPMCNCYFFSSFFYSKIFYDQKEYNYKAVARWTKKLSIFALDKLIFPVHLSNHWCLAVINFRDKRFEYYDSLHGGNAQCMECMKRYVQDESMDKRKQAFDISDWTEYTPTDIPRQNNFVDCGMFALGFAECTSRDIRVFDFDQKHMPYLRMRVCADILTKSVVRARTFEPRENAGERGA